MAGEGEGEGDELVQAWGTFDSVAGERLLQQQVLCAGCRVVCAESCRGLTKAMKMASVPEPLAEAPRRSVSHTRLRLQQWVEGCHHTHGHVCVLQLGRWVDLHRCSLCPPPAPNTALALPAPCCSPSSMAAPLRFSALREGRMAVVLARSQRLQLALERREARARSD